MNYTIYGIFVEDINNNTETNSRDNKNNIANAIMCISYYPQCIVERDLWKQILDLQRDPYAMLDLDAEAAEIEALRIQQVISNGDLK